MLMENEIDEGRDPFWKRIWNDERWRGTRVSFLILWLKWASIHIGLD
jgi:hypothetical protein